MGSGRWSTDVYDTAAKSRAAAGRSTFHYSDTTRTSARSSWAAHASLDPKGVVVRESCDSAEHPDAMAVAVLFDVTGSMDRVPTLLQAKLPGLYGLLLRKGYLSDPQVMFGGIGDATCDRVPLQVGQFESDNRSDDDLANIFLEGGGGGQRTESYELALYFMARHTSLDCYTKRGKRGYLFIIGDEMPYGKVRASEVRKFIGDELEADIPVADIVAEVQQRYDVYYILPEGTSYFESPEIIGAWRKLLGQNVILIAHERDQSGNIVVDAMDAVCETIGLTIGLGEGTIDLDEGLDDLHELGVGAAAGTVGKALATVGARGGAVAVADAPSDLAGDDGTERL